MAMVNHPPHYNRGKIEVIDFIEDQELNFSLGNALKYLCRAGAKPGVEALEDLRKARWYLEREIAFRQHGDQIWRVIPKAVRWEEEHPDASR